MKIQLTIHISAVDRLYNDKIITSEEYNTIMARLISERIKEKESADNG